MADPETPQPPDIPVPPEPEQPQQPQMGAVNVGLPGAKISLSNIGRIHYNGCEFGPWTVTTGISCQPQYDRAGRTITHTIMTFNFQTPISPNLVATDKPSSGWSYNLGDVEDPFVERDDIGNPYQPRSLGGPTVGGDLGADQRFVLAETTDPVIEAIRKKLAVPGGEFIFERRGFGALRVNVRGNLNEPTTGPVPVEEGVIDPTEVRDVNFGPKPRVATYKPLGADRCWMLVFSIEVAIPECCSPRYSGQPMEINYRLSFAKDYAGYQKLTYSGYFKIPMTRRSVDDRTLPDHADAYRSWAYPQAMYGFRRTSESWELNEAKNEMSFSITDEELPERCLPPGFVRASLTHSQHNESGGNFIIYTHVLQGQYELEPGRNRRELFRQFLLDIWQRIAAIVNQGYAILPISFSSTEPDAYGRAVASFSFSFTVMPRVLDKNNDGMLQDAEAEDALTKANLGYLGTLGLWIVPQDGNMTNWPFWADSVSDTVFNSRGRSNLRFNQEGDRIVDLCSTDGLSVSMDSTAITPTLNSIAATLNVARPLARQSYLFYQNSGSLIEESNVSIQKALAEVEKETTTPLDFTEQTANPNQYSGASAEAAITERASPVVSWVEQGKAIRVGFPVAPPKRTQIGGVPAVAANTDQEFFEQAIVGHAGQPLYVAKWRQKWLLPKAPETVSPPEHPNLSQSATASGEVSPGEQPDES